MSIHRCFKIFEIAPTNQPMSSGECKLIDLHSINPGMPRYFTDLGSAEQWLKYNGGQGLDPKHTIMEVLYWDYEK